MRNRVDHPAVAWPAQKFWGAKMFDFRRIALYCLGYRLSKHKGLYVLKIRGDWPLGPPGYAYVIQMA